MTPHDLRRKAQELRRMAQDLTRMADYLEQGSQPQQPDLFSQMGIADEPVMPQVEEITKPATVLVPTEPFGQEVKTFIVEPAPEPAPEKRIYQRVGCKMKDNTIVAATKVGRAQGWCQRSDIERSLSRKNPDRSREQIREAVNAAVEELGLTCIVFNSYRYYRRSARGLIIAKATAKLCA